MNFFFTDTATTEIYTLSLHDALPISRLQRSHRAERRDRSEPRPPADQRRVPDCPWTAKSPDPTPRSEEHTSELQSQSNLVCRLLLEKKKKTPYVYDAARPCRGRDTTQ